MNVRQNKIVGMKWPYRFRQQRCIRNIPSISMVRKTALFMDRLIEHVHIRGLWLCAKFRKHHLFTAMGVMGWDLVSHSANTNYTKV